MADGVVTNIVSEILTKLGSAALVKVAAAWGYKARLQQLEDTINTINNVLLDAEERQEESQAIRGWLQRLQSVLYTADDLFDELATVASMKEAKDGAKLTKEVKLFLSRFNQMTYPFTISKKITSIKQKLDAIVKDGNEFKFVLRSSEKQGLVHRSQRDQTHSFVEAEEVIGRDEDKKVIIEILLTPGSSTEQKVSVVPIVGMGGLGKTTLAQSIYNDVNVVKHFELRLWVCVSDCFDEKEIIRKILKSATNTEPQNLEMDQLQGQLRKEIGGKKYLLVLDDVWNEDRKKWQELNALLIGKEGSKMLVTTRSGRVAEIMGTVPAYNLRGLSKEKSWVLFKKMAFAPGQENNSPQIVEAGKEIVKKCGNVPLAVKTLGSLLFGKPESKWLSIKDIRSFAKISDTGNDITPILKLSYDNLWSPLKNCFAYCALFPKDYRMEKEKLINLWMAEGFLIPTDERQSPEETGEEYFSTLLQRCFFQDAENDEWGNIKSCKVHDLLHDLAQEVAGVESKMTQLGESKLNKRIRRLSMGYRLTSTQGVPNCVLNLKHLHTFLLPEQIIYESCFSGSVGDQLITGFSCLRVLELNNLGVKTLASSIGKLIHLRYLNLSNTPIEALPASITDLQNLQALNLFECHKLWRLPNNIRKLTNLRNLDLGKCRGLRILPTGVGELTSLHKLGRFPVGGEWRNGAQLSELKNLNLLRGKLEIQICSELKNPTQEGKEANLSSKHGLVELDIVMGDLDSNVDHDEAVLEGLKPHPNLKKLVIEIYGGRKLPSWAVIDNLCICLPNLVEIKLSMFRYCQQVPTFGQFPFLKCLFLYWLDCVEYMESSSGCSNEAEGETPLFFPSLESLTLIDMKKLKGWWKEVGPHSQKSFPRLSHLIIESCPNLTSFPECPNVRDLKLSKTNKRLSVLKMAAASAVRGSSSSSTSGLKLEMLGTDDVEELISLSKDCLLNHLSSLQISDENIQSTTQLQHVFKSLPSLRYLQFERCTELRSISRGLEHLTALQHLRFLECQKLDWKEEEEDGMPWKALNHTLKSLHFNYCNLTTLPKGLQHLTNLRHLQISVHYHLEELPETISCLCSLEFMELTCCFRLKSLPQVFRQLTNLNTLKIEYCPELTKRCGGPTGEDWPKIQHIPILILKDYFN